MVVDAYSIKLLLGWDLETVKSILNGVTLRTWHTRLKCTQPCHEVEGDQHLKQEVWVALQAAH